MGDRKTEEHPGKGLGFQGTEPDGVASVFVIEIFLQGFRVYATERKLSAAGRRARDPHVGHAPSRFIPAVMDPFGVPCTSRAKAARGDGMHRVKTKTRS